MAMEKSTASSTNVEFEIVHAVRGRVRLRLKGNFARELLPDIAHHLRQQAGIHKVQIKQTSNSLVVSFEPDVISIEQLTESLQSFGFSQISTEAREQLTKESRAITYSRLFSVVPPLVGLAIARGLKVSGWKSILTYILAAGVTREVIDQVTGEAEESEKVELSPAKKVSTTEIITEEIAPLLTAIATDYEIVHQIPGRIRLRVSRISRDRNYARELKHSLEQDKRITDVRLKTNSSSVVILYDPEALSDSKREKLAVNGSNGKKVIQATNKSESSTIPKQKKQKTRKKKQAKESDLNDKPPSGGNNLSEPISLPSETEIKTSDNLETEEESTTPIAHDESEIEGDREFTQKEAIINADYWSNFKSSILLTMLQLMGNLQVQTAEI